MTRAEAERAVQDALVRKALAEAEEAEAKARTARMMEQATRRAIDMNLPPANFGGKGGAS